MRSDISLVKAGPELASRIARLEKLCFSDPWPEELLSRQLADPLNEFIAAVTGEGELAGYIGMMLVLDEGYVHNVAVSPRFRREGIGAALVESALELGRGASLRFVTLEARESNAGAIALYSAAGFMPAGRREKYYVNPSEAAVLMTYYYRGNLEC